MKIGSLKLKNRFFLAPMLEPNDIAFRFLCKKARCGLTYSGMINPQSKKKISLDDKPAVQLFANSTKDIKSFVRKYDSKVVLWDFNLGCASKLAKKMKFGVFLQPEITKIKEIVKEIRSSTKKPITIKLRKTDYCFKIISAVEKYINGICIHPRTAEQGYSGEPDLNFALKIKKFTKLPVIYSGDVNEKNAKELLESFDFVMVGREAIGNPSIFSKLNKKNKKFLFKDYLKLAKKYKLSFRQIKYQALCFTKGKKNAKELRRKLAGTNNIEEIVYALKNEDIK